MKAAATLFDPEKIEQGTIDRWYADLAATERARLEARKGSAAKKESIIARFLLQHLAAATLAGNWCVETQSDQSIRLISDEGVAAASLSHTAGAVMVALSSAGDIGVDIEHHRANDVEKIVNRYFSDEDREDFYAAAPQDRMANFLRVWCAREALIKFQRTGTMGMLLGSPLRLPSRATHQSPALPRAGFQAAMICHEPAIIQQWEARVTEDKLIEFIKI
jgi:phosphopantetheinyl transferase